MDSAWLGVIIPVAIALGVAISQFLTSRRTSSGNIETSEANVLWQQSQTMMDNMQQRLNREMHQKERAEDQRDKLMELVEDQMMPALKAVTLGQQHILGMLTEMAGHIGKQ